jgi:long-chain acyl-CoA synthetase
MIDQAAFRERMLGAPGWAPQPGGLVRYELEHPTLDRLFEARARTYGDRRFVRDDAGEWRSWTQTAGAVARLAASLRASGISAGDRIAVLSENRVETLVLLLAAARLGAIGVPLNWRLTGEELRPILRDCAPALVVVEDRYEDAVPADMARVRLGGVGTPGELRDLAHEGKGEPLPPASSQPDQPVFLLYTSGTTGIPKAAVLTHDNVLQNAQNFARALQTTPDDTALIAVPLFHVTGLMAQFVHMVQVGGSCVLQERFRAPAFLDAVERHRITYTCAVPTIFRLLLLEPDLDTRRLDSFRSALFGGAALPPDTIEELSARFPALALVNCYGATESTGTSAFLPPELARSHPLSVGYAVPNVEIAIVDDEGAPVPDGTPGEIVMRGPTVARGYWRRPEATEFRWGGWTSGDVAQRDEQGLIYLLDRRKDVINRGGEKIFTIELENVLHEHPAVAEVAVTAVPDDIFGEQALAVVVPRPDAVLDAEEVRAYVRARLAAYKAPRHVQFTDALPKGGSGKFDKRALRRFAPVSADREGN